MRTCAYGPLCPPTSLKPAPGLRRRLRGLILPVAVFGVVFAGALVDWSGPISTAKTLIEQAQPAPPVDQHFSGCDAARAAGRVNIARSDPSYRERMDGDGDGLACEPYW